MSIPVSKTLDEVRQALYARLSEMHAEYAAQGWLPRALNLNKGVVRGLIELWAWGLYALYKFLFAILEQAFPESATGLWLDLHAGQVGLARLAATKAEGAVTFTGAASGNIVIPAGRIVKTTPDGAGNVYRFVTTAQVVMPDGATEVDAPVVAEEYGRAANVTAGSITEIATVVSGVTGVTNRDGWLTSEGADEETDAALQTRYALRWTGNNALTKYAYQLWALSVSGVVAVTVFDQHPRGQGTVDIVVKGAAGMPTETLLASVREYVAQYQPQNDDVLVKAPVAYPVRLAVTLVLVSGDSAAVIAEAETRLRAMFLDPSPVEDVTPLQIGDDLTRDRLVHVLMAISGVKRVRFSSPALDVTIAHDELATLDSLAVATEWAEEA